MYVHIAKMIRTYFIHDSNLSQKATGQECNAVGLLRPYTVLWCVHIDTPPQAAPTTTWEHVPTAQHHEHHLSVTRVPGGGVALLHPQFTFLQKMHMRERSRIHYVTYNTRPWP